MSGPDPQLPLGVPPAPLVSCRTPWKERTTKGREELRAQPYPVRGRDRAPRGRSCPAGARGTARSAISDRRSGSNPRGQVVPRRGAGNCAPSHIRPEVGIEPRGAGRAPQGLQHRPRHRGKARPRRPHRPGVRPSAHRPPRRYGPRPGSVGRPLPGTARHGGPYRAGRRDAAARRPRLRQVLERHRGRPAGPGGGTPWFPTGDLGELDADGYPTITGRKKEIIITAGGKNVAPAPLADRLRPIPWSASAWSSATTARSWPP